jgi:hypothetical protein
MGELGWSALALRDTGGKWTKAAEGLWSEDALTAAVLSRYHIIHAIKRAIGSKLGKAGVK